MDHGKDPYLHLITFTVMLMIGPSVEIAYHNFESESTTWNDLTRVFWINPKWLYYNFGTNLKLEFK